MTIEQLLKLLKDNKDALLSITLPSGETVPEHFHVTEVGTIHKRFIDCGGTARESFSCMMQAWVADDVEHRIDAAKLLKIFNAASKSNVMYGDDYWVIDLLPIEIEYGADVATQYALDSVQKVEYPSGEKGLSFILTGKKTDCLAPDKCGIKPKPKCEGNKCCC